MVSHLADYEKVYIKSNRNLEIVLLHLMLLLYAGEMKNPCSHNERFLNNELSSPILGKLTRVPQFVYGVDDAT